MREVRNGCTMDAFLYAVWNIYVQCLYTLFVSDLLLGDNTEIDKFDDTAFAVCDPHYSLGITLISNCEKKKFFFRSYNVNHEQISHWNTNNSLKSLQTTLGFEPMTIRILLGRSYE